MEGAPPSTRPLHILVKCIELSVAPLLGLIISAILNMKHGRHRFAILLVCNIVVQIASIFGGWAYFVDAENFYHHGSFYWVYALTYSISMLYVAISILFSVRHYQYNSSVFPIMIVVFCIAGTLVRNFNNGLRMDWPTVTFVGILLYVFNCEMVQQTDHLTALVNRRGYATFIMNIHEPVTIMYFDVDHFKNVNDRYGHAYGDVCLKCIGKYLRSTYSPYGRCFRIGGDEFCVILTKKLKDVEELNSRFFNIVSDARRWDMYTLIPQAAVLKMPSRRQIG